MSEDPASLENLHDIVVPDAVSWWPLAPGWIVLASLLLLASVYLATRWYRSWKANAYRRAALHELEGASSPVAVAEILRRTALAIAPREAVAALHGEAWTKWLAANGPHPADAAAILTSSIYDPHRSRGDLETLRDFARLWILHHSRPC